MPKFTLFANRPEYDMMELGSRETDNATLAFAWAEGRIEGLHGDAAEWPCGWDAVIMASDGRSWMMTDDSCWEPIMGTLTG